MPGFLSDKKMATVPQLHNQRHFQDFRCRNNDLNYLGKSPIKVDFLLTCLEQYPMKEDAKLLADGFTNAFCLQYSGPRHISGFVRTCCQSSKILPQQRKTYVQLD